MSARRDIPQRTHATNAIRIASVAAVSLLGSCAVPTAVAPPPSGGTTLVLSYTEFAASVEPVLIQHGCDAAGDCHGGGPRGTLELSPPTAKDTLFDFEQVRLQVSTAAAESSDILLRPLADTAGGRPHPYKVFATNADPGYQAILHWINDGVKK